MLMCPLGKKKRIFNLPLKAESIEMTLSDSQSSRGRKYHLKVKGKDLIFNDANFFVIIMEIEAKFLVQDETVFSRIAGMTSIASFEVGEMTESIFRDTYLDTPDMAIYSSGYSFRYREKPGKTIFTLKSLEHEGSSIHKREEIEVSCPEKRKLDELEEGRLKDLLLRLAGSGRLFPLFEVGHKRRTALITDHARELVELSLDDVTISCEGNDRSYLEVELELRDSTEEELTLMVSAMGADFGLAPGNSSKFDNGLEMLQENVRNLASRMDYSGISLRTGLHPLPLQEMFQEYDVEISHARKVAENSLELFDRLAPVHGLDPGLRIVMRMAALVHDVGFTIDVKDHHKEGRDILLAHPPAEFPFPLFLMLPWTTFLHKKRIDEHKLEKLRTKKDFADMPLQMQNHTLRLAAILRIADGLDYSRMDSRIEGIDLQEDKAIIRIQGPGAQTDAQRADSKCDLWRILFKTDLQLRPALHDQG
jgi:exopolyphosphatase/guanosine-5'-triphosphate,3'-diphosphate pyrophosphatase